LTITVLLVLIALWAAVLVPPLLRARTVQRSSDTIGDFHYRLSVLGRTGDRRPNGALAGLARIQGARRPAPGSSLPTFAGSMSPTQRRRRNVLMGLAGVASVTMVLALSTGSWMMWFLNIVSLLATGGYVWLLVQMKQGAFERQTKVRYLHRNTTADADVASLARRASM
jgi:hypothetical protein